MNAPYRITACGTFGLFPTEDWLREDMPPFRLTETQKAQLASYRTEGARRTALTDWHQEHCWKHRQVLGMFGSVDPYHFTRRWERDFGNMRWAAGMLAAAREEAHV